MDKGIIMQEGIEYIKPEDVHLELLRMRKELEAIRKLLEADRGYIIERKEGNIDD